MLTLTDALQFIMSANKADLAEAAAAVAEKPARKKRTLSPEQKAKMAAGRAKAKAAKGVSTPAAKVEKPKVDRLSGWAVTPHTTKRKVKGKIVRVGPFTAFIPEGDKAKRAAAIEAINGIFRTDAIRQVVAQF